MKLKDIQNIFHKELDAAFGENEVSSFFQILIAHYLKLNRISLVLEPELTLTKTEEQPLFEALSRLKNEEPIQYIIGETEFYGLPFKVNENTLIPRPETEELVEMIVDAAKSKNKTLKILDIGTGTGCIAVSLAKNLPQAQVFALDVSGEALKVARKNAQLNDVNITFFEADILNANSFNSEFINLEFDIIVSNPPYVRDLEKAEIKNNVLDYEPHLALFVANKNPLQFYKAIAEFAQRKLKENGLLYFEINQYLGDEMIQLMEDNHFKEIELKQDVFGENRMLKGRKRED